MSTEYELSHQDSITATSNGLIIKNKTRHTLPESDEEIELEISAGSGSEEDEILRSDDDVEKFISKRQMSYPPLPRYESPVQTTSVSSKEKLGILTPPMEESACNSIKSGRSSRDGSTQGRPLSMTRHVSFSTMDRPEIPDGGEIQEQRFERSRAESPAESMSMSVSPPPKPENNHVSSEESEGEDDPDVGRGQRESPVTRTNTWECSHILPVADLVLEGLIANFHRIQGVEALLLFASEFGSNLKKVHVKSIFQYFNDISEILAELCSSSHFRLNMEAFNATNSLAERLRQLKQPLQNQFPKAGECDLTPLIRQFCSISGEAKSVLKTEGGATFSKLIRGAGPGLVTDSIFKIINPSSKSNSKVKAAALDALTLLLLTFPRDEFQLEEVAKEVCSVLLSPKRRLRLAALECLSVVANALGPTMAMPLFRQLIEQEISNGFRSSTLPRRNNMGGQSSASKAVSARVSRRVLPSASHSGLVNYAMLPLPTTNRSFLKSNPELQFEEERDGDLDLDEYGFLEPIIKTAGTKFSVMGADILYVLRGSGGGARVNSKSPSSSSGSDGKFESSEFGKTERLSSRSSRSRDRERGSLHPNGGELAEESRLDDDMEENSFTGFTRVSPFNSPNVIKQEHFASTFIEHEASRNEYIHRYSTNDLRSSEKPSKTEHRRGSDGYTNVNLQKSTPHLSSRQEFTVMALEQNHNFFSNMNAVGYLNGNHRNLIDDEDDEIEDLTLTRNQRLVDESEEIESKKSSAGSSTRDSGVSSLKSAGRMLTNDSPPSTGERADIEADAEAEAEDEPEDVEILEAENANEEEGRQTSPKPAPSRGSESDRSPTETNSVLRRSPGTPKYTEETKIPRPSTQFRPVENSPPPPALRPNTNGDRSDFLPRKPVQVRTTPRKKLSPAFQSTEDIKRASTSPGPFRATESSHIEKPYAPIQNGHYDGDAEYTNGNALDSREGDDTPSEILANDIEDDVDYNDTTESPSGNSGESTSSRTPPFPYKTKSKCTFLKKGSSMVIPAATRRVYKGSFRESNSQARPVHSTADVFPQDLKPLDSPRHGLSHGIQKLASPEWETNIEGFRLIVRLIRHNPEYLLKPPSSELHNIILSGLRHLGNLRSQVCRAACLFFKELFSHLDPLSTKAVEQDMEKISEKLLDKSMDTNKFIRDDSGSALDSMVTAMPTTKCINTLDAYGTKHRNAIVRKTTARLLGIIIRRLGPERVLNEFPEKTLPMLVRFLQEGNLETRTHAKSSLSFLASNPSFDIQLRRSVPLDLLRHSDKAIYNLKQELKAARNNSTHRL